MAAVVICWAILAGCRRVGGLGGGPLPVQRPWAARQHATCCEPSRDNASSPYSRDDDLFLWGRRTAPVEEVAAALGRGTRGVAARLRRLEDPLSEGHRRLFFQDRFGTPTAGSGGGKPEPGSPAALRPAREVVDRVLWDPALDAADFRVGYRDRFKLALSEAPFTEPNTSVQGPERLLVYALPEHRIEYIKYRKRLVWRKETRLDLVFGSGVHCGDPLKIQQVVSSYAEWAAARSARAREARAGALAHLGSDELLSSFFELLGRVRNGELSRADFVDEALSPELFGAGADAGGGEALIGVLRELPDEFSELREALLELVAERVRSLRLLSAGTSQAVPS
ncbi:hypothetical protein T492DRAFT_1060640 [Pavlovales sp. CCMP2436]|nr:hypothetical protein T492DRAFT_1060640 [Pavlovales sp. CCMP2436]